MPHLVVRLRKAEPEGWIGVDLDGTLAEHGEWKGGDHIGDPVPAMVARVRRWLAQGKQVRIFTARAEDPANIPPIRAWLGRWGLPDLPITNRKDRDMIELWDDRAVQVEPNTGRRVHLVIRMAKGKPEQLGLFGHQVTVKGHVRHTKHGIEHVAPHHRHQQGGGPAQGGFDFSRRHAPPEPEPAPPSRAVTESIPPRVEEHPPATPTATPIDYSSGQAFALADTVRQTGRPVDWRTARSLLFRKEQWAQIVADGYGDPNSGEFLTHTDERELAAKKHAAAPMRSPREGWSQIFRPQKGGKGAKYRHDASGMVVAHCGGTCPLYPYSIQDPAYPDDEIVSFNGLAFAHLEPALKVAEELAAGEVTTSAEGMEARARRVLTRTSDGHPAEPLTNADLNEARRRRHLSPADSVAPDPVRVAPHAATIEPPPPTPPLAPPTPAEPDRAGFEAALDQARTLMGRSYGYRDRDRYLTPLKNWLDENIGPAGTWSAVVTSDGIDLTARRDFRVGASKEKMQEAARTAREAREKLGAWFGDYRPAGLQASLVLHKGKSVGWAYDGSYSSTTSYVTAAYSTIRLKMRAEGT